LFCIRNQT